MIVVKIGGARGINLDDVCADVAALAKEGQRVVLVHGAGHEADDLGERLGYPARHVTSPQGFTSRYTDRQTLEIYAMAAVGKVNTFLCERLQRLGVNAIGLSGVSGRVLEGTRKDAIRIVENGRQGILRDDYTGRDEKDKRELRHAVLDARAPLMPVHETHALTVRGSEKSSRLQVTGAR